MSVAGISIDGPPTPVVTLGARTHSGRVRPHNEDSFVARPDLGLWLVADGMGGFEGGEIASRIVTETVTAEIADGALLPDAVFEANNALIDAIARGIGKPSMGTTLVAVLVRGVTYEIAWAGDSRCYLWDGQLSQVTRDHSRVQQMIDAGLISPADARNHPHRNLVTRAIDGREQVGELADVRVGMLHPEQRLLLCSDGLTAELDDPRIAAILAEESVGSRAVDRLVEATLEAGARDNVTVVLLGFPAITPTGARP